MVSNHFKEEKIAGKPVRVLPNVFIMMPFEPLTMHKSLLESKLKGVLYNVESELLSCFSESIANKILEKLKSIIAGLDHTSQRKSIAIYISTIVEKVYYLNKVVKEEVIVGKPFSIRNIVYNKKEEEKYLLLVLTGESTRIFVGEPDKLTLNVINLPEQVATYAAYGDSDINMEEVFLNKFVKHADDVLSLLLKCYTLPLFVMATPKTRKLFLSLTKHNEQVLVHIEIESDDITEKEILATIKPLIENWKKVKQKDLQLQLAQAEYNGKLVAGIEEVWQTAKQSKSRLLALERNYIFPAYFEESEEVAYMKNVLPHFPTHLKDAVDDAIENVLKDGGDVEFVEAGTLNDYLHIALIKD